jgi:hypothetical protein
MPYNASGQSFQPIYGAALGVPAPYRMEVTNVGLSTAQMNANANFTPVTVTSTATLVDAAKKRTTRITVVVPTDQPPITLGNTAGIGANSPTSISQTSTPPVTGFTLQPGQQMILQSYNDPLYAITQAGLPNATIFFYDS